MDQADPVRPDHFQQRPGAQGDPGLLDQPQGNRVGPPHVGPHPVARLDQHVGGHGREAAVHYRLDGDDPLHVGHLADPAVLGQRVADDEQALVDRLVHGQHGDLGDRPGGIRPDGRGFERVQQFAVGGGEGLDADLPVRGRPLHAIHRIVAGGPFFRPLLKHDLAILRQRHVEQCQQVEPCSIRLEIRRRL